MKLIYYSLLAISLLVSCKKNETTQNSISSSVKDSAMPPLTVKDTNNLINIEKPVEIVQQEPVNIPKEKEYQTETVKTMQDSSKYYIYFTLDDGPQPGTRTCMDILKANNVRATFFMVGAHNEGKERQNLVDSINNDHLFLVSNHSDTHGFHNKYRSFYNNPKSSFADFINAESKLNIKHKIARLPGRNTWAINNKLKGESSAFAVARKLDSAGYSVYGWDIEWRFTKGSIPVESADEMIKSVEKKLKNGKTYKPKSIVILVHDRMFQKPQYADSLKKFITTLKKNDKYIFDTLDNFPTLTSLEKENK